MIKANELRLGSIVEGFADSGKEKVVFKGPIASIFSNTKISMGSEPGNGIHINLDSVNPILITEEILEKAGFKYRSFLNDYFIVINDNDAILIYKDWATMLCGSNQQSIILNSRVNYLHQLQNLYYSLTGEELEITL